MELTYDYETRLENCKSYWTIAKAKMPFEVIAEFNPNIKEKTILKIIDLLAKEKL